MWFATQSKSFSKEGIKDLQEVYYMCTKIAHQHNSIATYRVRPLIFWEKEFQRWSWFLRKIDEDDRLSYRNEEEP